MAEIPGYSTVWTESFDNGTGMLSRTWGPGVDTSVSGQVTLHSTPDNQDSGTMVPPTGADAGNGYGLYSFTLSMGQGDAPGPYALLWPGTDVWPGPELDMIEVLPGGGAYSTIHLKGADGGNAYSAYDLGSVDVTQPHTYSMEWQEGRLTGYVDGKEAWTTTDDVPKDFAHGGENETPGVGMQTWWSADAQHGSGSDNTLTVYDVSYAAPTAGGVVVTPDQPQQPEQPQGPQQPQGPDLPEQPQQPDLPAQPGTPDSGLLHFQVQTPEHEIAGWQFGRVVSFDGYGAGATVTHEVGGAPDEYRVSGENGFDTFVLPGVTDLSTLTYVFDGAVPAEPAQPSEPEVPAQPELPGGGTDAATGSPEAQLLALINADRADLGLSALVVDHELATAAGQHSADMLAQGYFEHNGLDGSTPGDRIEGAGYDAQGWGENIAWVSGNGDTTVDAAEIQQLHDNLMASPGHYANLMSASFKEVGLGLTATAGKVMLTEDFGTPTAAEVAEGDKGFGTTPTQPEPPVVVTPDLPGDPVVVPPVEPQQPEPPVVVTPDAPETEARGELTGGAGKDTLQLNHAFHFNVDGGAGKDVINLGHDHGDVTVIMQAGQVKGDLVAGLDFGAGDHLSFHGYGDDAVVKALGNGSFKVSDGAGHAEKFTLLGVTELHAGDYNFV